MSRRGGFASALLVLSGAGRFIESKLYGGGNRFSGPFGTVYASNITPDAT